MRSVAATSFCALALVCLCGTAAAARPNESGALFRVVATLVGTESSRAIPVVEESAARFQTRRASVALRGYGPAARAHDAAVLDALGIPRRRRRSPRRSSPRGGRSRSTTRAPAGSTCSAAPATSGLHWHAPSSAGCRPGSTASGRTVVAARDARLAELAASQGHAALVAARLGRVPAIPVGGSRLERFVALESSFTASVGLRFAATLQNLGGRRAVSTALSRRPESTEQIFHIDKFLERERPVAVPLPAEAAGLARASVGTFGELDVRTLLAVAGAPKVDAIGTGWAGGRTALYRSDVTEAALVALAWDSLHDAGQWEAAVPAYLRLAFGLPVAPDPSACAAIACWQIGERGIAFHRSGTRTWLAVAESVDGAAAVARSAAT